VLADEAREHLDQALGADRACHVDGQALSGELVDDRQAFELLAVGTRVEDEVVGPDEVRARRRRGRGRSVAQKFKELRLETREQAHCVVVLDGPEFAGGEAQTLQRTAHLHGGIEWLVGPVEELRTWR